MSTDASFNRKRSEINRTFSEPRALRAVIDARSLAPELFGTGPAARTRKYIFLYLATFADADGGNAFPSRERIARDTGLTVRALDGVLAALKARELLKIDSKGSWLSTNMYTLTLAPEAIEQCRAKQQENPEQVERLERTHQRRVDAARRRWQKQRGQKADAERCVQGDPEHCVQHGTLNTEFREDPEQIACDPEQIACDPEQNASDAERSVQPTVTAPLSPSLTPKSPPTHSAEIQQAGVGADDDVDPFAFSPSTAPGQPSPKTKIFEAPKFLGLLRRTWKRHQHEPLSTTDAHCAAACKKAITLGPELFLSAWDHFLQTVDDGELEVVVGKELNPRTGEQQDKTVQRKWVLHYFMESGALDEHIDLVRPFVEIAEGGVLAFLVEAEGIRAHGAPAQQPVRPTAETIVQLHALLSRYTTDEVIYVWQQHCKDRSINEFVAEADALLTAQQELDRELRERAAELGKQLRTARTA